jgi:hypothetical protein
MFLRNHGGDGLGRNGDLWALAFAALAAECVADVRAAAAGILVINRLQRGKSPKPFWAPSSYSLGRARNAENEIICCASSSQSA